MYVRLAFAVAAHLEPEILIVDEVLAVGDAQFQKKCLGKMQEVGQSGRTVFVCESYDERDRVSVYSRKSCCNQERCALMGQHMRRCSTISMALTIWRVLPRLDQRRDRSGNGKVRAAQFRILDSNEAEVNVMQSGKDYIFEIRYESLVDYPLHNVAVSLDVFDDRANRLLLFRSNFTNENVSLLPSGGAIRCYVQDLPLANGSYRFSIFISHGNAEVFRLHYRCCTFDRGGGRFFWNGKRWVTESL